jgi:hypothetical protein
VKNSKGLRLPHYMIGFGEFFSDGVGVEGAGNGGRLDHDFVKSIYGLDASWQVGCMLNRQGTTTCVVYKSGRILFMEDYNKYYFLSVNRILIFMFTGLYIGFYFYMIGFYQYNVGFYISINHNISCLPIARSHGW